MDQPNYDDDFGMVASRNAKIPEFAEPKNDHDADNWVETVNMQRVASGWTDRQTAHQALLVLTGKAANWREALKLEEDPVRFSWKLLRPAFLARFRPSSTCMEQYSTMQKVGRQGEAESVDDFYDRCLVAHYRFSNSLRKPGYTADQQTAVK